MGERPQKGRRRIIRMVPVPKPDEGKTTVLVHKGPGTILMSNPNGPDIVMVCGHCGAPLIVGARVDQIRGIVFHCAKCQQYNETLVH